MAHTKRGVAAGLLLLGVLAVAAAYLMYQVGGHTEANLELAPVFVTGALAMTSVTTLRLRSRSRARSRRY